MTPDNKELEERIIRLEVLVDELYQMWNAEPALRVDAVTVKDKALEMAKKFINSKIER